MDPSLYQQRQQQDRVLYSLPVNSQTGSSVGGYPQQYLTSTSPNNTAAYVGSGNGVNSIIQIAGNRPIYPAPVASVSSLSSNGMPPAKRVALGSPLQNVYQNITTSNAMQNQLYTHSANFSNQVLATGRSSGQTPTMLIGNPNVEAKPTTGTVPANLYVSLENANKYPGQYPHQIDQKLAVGNINNLLNQPPVQQTPPQNTPQPNFVQADDSDMYWLNLGDLNEEYDFPFAGSDAEYVNNASDFAWSSPIPSSNLDFMSHDSKLYSSISQPQQPSQQQLETGDDQQQKSQDLDEQGQSVRSQHSSQSHHSLPLQSLPSQRNQQPPHLISSQQSQQQEHQEQQTNEDSIYGLSSVSMISSGLNSQDLASKNNQQSTVLLGRSSPTIQPSVDSPNALSEIFNNQSDTLELDSQVPLAVSEAQTSDTNKDDESQQSAQPYQYQHASGSSNELSPPLPGSVPKNATDESPKGSPQPSQETNEPPIVQSSSLSPTKDAQAQAKQTLKKPQKVTYIPKTRTVDTYGGIDLRVFERLSVPLNLPALLELGSVDIHALIMSLKSEMKLETTTALNTLTTITCQRNPIIDMKFCGELMDVLLDIIVRYVDRVTDGTRINLNSSPTPRKFRSYQELLLQAKQEQEGFSEVVYGKKNLTDECYFLREQCLCVLNLIRNLSFADNNQMYLAAHPRLLDVLMRTLYLGLDEEGGGCDVSSGKKCRPGGTTRMRKRAFDILECRKSVLIIFSNIASYLSLPSVNVSRDILLVIADFLSNAEDYYVEIALEVFAKLSVDYENRQRIGGCDDETLLLIFKPLLHMLPSEERIVMTRHQDLAHLETVVMAMYNLSSLSREEVRKNMVGTTGLIGRLLKLTLTLARRQPEYEQNPFLVLCRRAVETLKMVSKDNKGALLVHTEQLLNAILNPYIDPVIVQDLEATLYPGEFMS